MIIPARATASRAIAVAAAIGGALVAWHYHALGLTLSHYDARGHLIVARRIIDSITPGWQQIGAVWLPLPHLLNALPVQIDRFYRSGASAVALSILEYAIAAGAIAWIVESLTGSAVAALVRRRGVRAQPERAVSPVDADDRAAAAGDDDGRDCDDDGVGAGRPEGLRYGNRDGTAADASRRPSGLLLGLGVRAGVSDALRSLAGDGERVDRRGVDALAARAAAA